MNEMEQKWIIVIIMMAVIMSILFMVIIVQQNQISSLEYRSSIFGNQSSEFAEQIAGLKIRLAVACAFREPSTDENINWTRVCEAKL